MVWQANPTANPAKNNEEQTIVFDRVFRYNTISN